MFNEEGYRVSPLRVRLSTCPEMFRSMLVTRRVGNILLPRISTVVQTRMTRIKTGSKICSVATSSMPLVEWRVANSLVTLSTLTNVLHSVVASSVITLERKSGIPSWRLLWSTPVP